MMIKKWEGVFITFEGIDCSGKSTQVKKFVERLSNTGREVVFTREPGGTPVSENIRAMLKENYAEGLEPATELLLFEAARSQIVGKIIRPALDRGAIVVCDRFTDSTFAYQGYGRAHDLTTLESLNKFATGGLSPDLTFLINITPEERIKRLGNRNGEAPDRFELEMDGFTKRVYAGYVEAAARNRERIVLIDGNRTVDEVGEDIWNIANTRLLQLRRQYVCV